MTVPLAMAKAAKMPSPEIPGGLGKPAFRLVVEGAEPDRRQNQSRGYRSNDRTLRDRIDGFREPVLMSRTSMTTRFSRVPGFPAKALAAALLMLVSASAGAQTLSSVAGNPGAVNVFPGTGAAGNLLGLSSDTGVRLGGVLVSNANVVASGGNAPGATSFNNLLIIDLQADLDKLAGIPGASFGTALLRFDGQPSNQDAGLATGYNGLTGPPPRDRTELYELWWRQSLFGGKLVVRIGKTVPTFDFGNVARPVPVADATLEIPAVSGLLYTPLFVNPTMLGALPGYYNSAYGVTATVTPTRRLYVSGGAYDGNVARGEQTGLRGAPTFNAYKFLVAEAGTAWLLGPDHLPGSFAAGVWDQTGTLTLPTSQGTITQDGTQGGYLFASQRLWRGHGNDDARGVSGFLQFGANDSRTMLATRFAGFGATAFGVIPGRPMDSIGAGLAWSWLNPNRRLDLRAHEVLLQFYDQLHVIGAWFLQPALTVSPSPGDKTADGPVVAFTVQSTILF